MTSQYLSPQKLKKINSVQNNISFFKIRIKFNIQYYEFKVVPWSFSLERCPSISAHTFQSPLSNLSLQPPTAPSTLTRFLFDTRCHTFLASAPCLLPTCVPTLSCPRQLHISFYSAFISVLLLFLLSVYMLCLCLVSYHVVYLIGQLTPHGSFCVVGWELIVALLVLEPIIVFSSHSMGSLSVCNALF